jgi:hypothetical protein
VHQVTAVTPIFKNSLIISLTRRYFKHYIGADS